MTIYPDLVDSLDGMPGAPFSKDVIAASTAAIRSAAGWHIAPEVDDEFIIDSPGGRELWLPTRRIVKVTSVQVRRNGQWQDAAGWDQDTGWSEDGILSLEHGSWPTGRRVVRVELTHGFPSDSDDLKLLVAVNCGRRIQSESISSRSITFADSGNLYGTNDIMSRYSLGPRS